MFIPSKDDHQNLMPRPDRYVVYGWQRSYFTHKLMAALDFYGADWEYRDKTRDNERELRLRSGTHQIPVLHTPEHWMLADTTPILYLLDGRFPARRLFPEGPMGVLAHLLEEFFDEWIARTTVHWRWNYSENHELLSLDAAHGDPDLAATMVTWGAKVCRATGVSSNTQQAAAEAEYHRLMAAAEAQLKLTPYLLGDRPTALDCIVLAGLRAHFLYDPAPNRVLRDRYPVVVDWAERRAAADRGGAVSAVSLSMTPFAKTVLAEMATTWQPFALANRQALASGERAFVINIYGEAVSYLARPYIEQSRQMLLAAFDSLGESAETLRGQLATLGLVAALRP